jgi:GNAT superfamily N-acetyltransferase
LDLKTLDNILNYLELDIKKSVSGGKAVPTPNPWGPGKCQEVYKLVWREEYDYLPGKWIGFIAVDNDRVRYSYLKRKYRGIGLGYALYEMVLQDRGELSTQWESISTQAKAVWCKLKENYKTRSYNGNLKAYNKYK